MNRGYVKLWRKSFDSGLMNNANLWLCWSWCLLKATHKKMKVLVGFKEVLLNPGQFIFGRHKTAAALNLSERNVRTCFEALKNSGRIAIETTNKYSIVSIIKWSDYQSEENVNDQQNDQQEVQQATSKRPASDQQATTNKNVKELKESINPPTPQRGEYTESFEKFWKQYPKKVGKDAAFKKWKQIGKSKKATAGELIQAIIMQVQANHFSGSNGDSYIPNPQTWLNQGRWKDEIKSGGACNPPPANLNPETRYQDGM